MIKLVVSIITIEYYQMYPLTNPLQDFSPHITAHTSTKHCNNNEILYLQKTHKISQNSHFSIFPEDLCHRSSINAIEIK